MKQLWAVALLLFALVSCSRSPTQPVIVPVSTMQAPNFPPANLPNPASTFCEEPGNRLEIRTAADGSQSGVYIFLE